MSALYAIPSNSQAFSSLANSLFVQRTDVRSSRISAPGGLLRPAISLSYQVRRLAIGQSRDKK
jgi:hypothetical protein